MVLCSIFSTLSESCTVQIHQLDHGRVFLKPPDEIPSSTDKQDMGAPVINHQKIDFDRRDFGRADSLSFNILTLVADENYDRAISQLNSFLETDSGYPSLRDKIERHVGHAIDIINAIRTKRNFPGYRSLTAAKQNELKEKTLFHFEELKQSLRKIERIQVDVKLEDIRSTVIVIRAVVVCAMAIMVVAFLKDISEGLLLTSSRVFDERINYATNLILDFLGL